MPGFSKSYLLLCRHNLRYAKVQLTECEAHIMKTKCDEPMCAILEATENSRCSETEKKSRRLPCRTCKYLAKTDLGVYVRQ